MNSPDFTTAVSASPGKPWEEEWDTVIIGGGPGGVSAGIYAMRTQLKGLLIEKSYIGGQVSLTNAIENFPGFLRVEGMDLAQRFDQHLKLFNLPVWNKTVSALRPQESGGYLVEVSTGEKVPTRTIIIASGGSPIRLPAENEEKFYGHGVSYCAICDGHFFRERPVCVVGGGGSAVQEAEYLSTICSRVTIIHRREGFRAQPAALSRLREKPNVDFKLNYVVSEVLGDDTVTGVILKHVQTGEKEELAVAAVFVYLGRQPNTDFARGVVEMDEEGLILVDRRMRTSQPGIFAVGDLTHGSLKQIVTACAEGSTAGLMAWHYLNDGEWPDSISKEQ